jgi:hypothetical protein
MLAEGVNGGDGCGSFNFSGNGSGFFGHGLLAL